MNMDIAWVVGTILSMIGLVILAMFYFYLDKLEKIGCACAEHKYRSFIKKFTVVAFVMSLLSVIATPFLNPKSMGPMFGGVMMFLAMLYVIALFVYFILTLVYIHYLKREKCRCSEEYRREIYYWFSVLEILILGAVVVLPLALGLLKGSVMLLATTGNKLEHSAAFAMSAVANPVKNVQKVPAALKRSFSPRR